MNCILHRRWHHAIAKGKNGNGFEQGEERTRVDLRIRRTKQG